MYKILPAGNARITRHMEPSPYISRKSAHQSNFRRFRWSWIWQCQCGVIFFVESVQGTEYFIHSLQCALGKEKATPDPYNFFYTMYRAQARTQGAFTFINKTCYKCNCARRNYDEVACLLVLHSTCRSGIIKSRAITPTGFIFLPSEEDNFFFFEKPDRSGISAVVARWQMLRHTPVATTSKAGATGISIFQNNVTPADGKNSLLSKSPAPTNQNKVWMTFR